jgi:hypothetical protein
MLLHFNVDNIISFKTFFVLFLDMVNDTILKVDMREISFTVILV